MSSGYIPAKDEPGPDEIVEALREAVFENGSTLGFRKTVRRRKKPPYCLIALPKTRDLVPSSYFPSAFSRQFGAYDVPGFCTRILLPAPFGRHLRV